MFGQLTSKLTGLMSQLTRKSRLTEDNISEAVREVRLALLEADVNYAVTKNFVKRVKEKCLGEEVLKSVTAGQQFVKVVHDELQALMGGDEAPLDLDSTPAVIMLCGLQGSGKTTQCAKLAKMLKKKEFGKNPLLVACDLQRPAAIEQLQTLGERIGVEVYQEPKQKNPAKVAKAALKHATKEGFDAVILDTAGRLSIDEALMKELKKIRDVAKPQEILFVANGATGQDAVNVARDFNERVEITGTILTMLDGNTRGGAAISIKEVTQRPLKFEGVGEGLDDLQVFNPRSMADRILGMGDTINLVKKAQEHIDEDEAKQLEKKLRNATFTYEDYLGQMQMIKKMGSIKSLLKMIPGMSQLENLNISDKEFSQMEAIILSMTRDERSQDELSPSRRKRIAKGCGLPLDRVNAFVKRFKQAKKMMKNMPRPNKKTIEKMMSGGLLCR